MKPLQKLACPALAVLLSLTVGCAEAPTSPGETGTEPAPTTAAATETTAPTQAPAQMQETTQAPKPSTVTYGEAITEIDGIPYAAYTETFYTGSHDETVDVGDLLLQRAEYEIKENEEIEVEYYLSTELIEQYYADDVTWDGEVCRFQKNHLTVTIADGTLTAEDPIFGRQRSSKCRTFVYNDMLYIDYRHIYDLLGITAPWAKKWLDAYIITRDFLIRPLPDMECWISDVDGAIARIYGYKGAEPITSLSAEPFMVSEEGLYYYEADGVYYADFDGAYYPLELTDYISRDVPQ